MTLDDHILPVVYCNLDAYLAKFYDEVDSIMDL